MPDEMNSKLKLLEQDYFEQPPVVQQSDLREINSLRTQLGLPLVDARLRVTGVAGRVPAPTEPQEPPRDHSEAREIYLAFLQKQQDLLPHQVYATQVARATNGAGQTPVKPLATLGTNGGPLLCDHCGKPMILEGGKFNRVYADVAWRTNPQEKWNSYISGGMVVEIQSNGTLRIYHGYRDMKGHCCTLASEKHANAEREFVGSMCSAKNDVLLPFLEAEFPNKSRNEIFDLLNSIVSVMYSYDPGIGVNRPSTPTTTANT